MEKPTCFTLNNKDYKLNKNSLTCYKHGFWIKKSSIVGVLKYSNALKIDTGGSSAIEGYDEAENTGYYITKDISETEADIQAAFMAITGWLDK